MAEVEKALKENQESLEAHRSVYQQTLIGKQNSTMEVNDLNSAIRVLEGEMAHRQHVLAQQRRTNYDFRALMRLLHESKKEKIGVLGVLGEMLSCEVDSLLEVALGNDLLTLIVKDEVECTRLMDLIAKQPG